MVESPYGYEETHMYGKVTTNQIHILPGTGIEPGSPLLDACTNHRTNRKTKLMESLKTDPW
ncbi:hypothetical protein DPMN_057623 [Dreissena polymorpha]|uniref:Uncharacterized protein n=1 Tax=Dreissena polymorpha TaxID=45954 RepID=A0A9D4HF45_DREPO|nr:hypothetical protein DPMN_057623 [Dreissena polymorpha]